MNGSTKILLGVSGGIAAHKSVDLASKLTQRGDEVRTILTPHALHFTTPLAFRGVTRQPVFTDAFEEDATARPEHISLSEWADVVCVAPATADVIAKIAAGLADNLLLLTLVACPAPVLIAPSMNDRMWANAIVRRNLETLRAHGYRVLDPGSGHLACGSTGPGRLPETPDLIREIDLLLGRR